MIIFLDNCIVIFKSNTLKVETINGGVHRSFETPIKYLQISKIQFNLRVTVFTLSISTHQNIERNRK